MRSILARRSRPVLAGLAGESALLVFDFDGTLAPIVDDPASALMRPGTRRLLRAVARGYPCAVISGRARRDLAPRLAGVDLAWIVGNHGAEWEATRAMGRLRPIVRSWSRQLAERLAPIAGVEVEDKGLSLTVHYRRAPDRGRAARAVGRAVRSLPGARLVPGKFGINVLHPGVPHKGAAFMALWARAGGRAALYVGDDETDEDVFRLRIPGRLVTVRVGAGRSTRAGYFVRTQREIDRLLTALLALRERSVPRKKASA